MKTPGQKKMYAFAKESLLHADRQSEVESSICISVDEWHRYSIYNFSLSTSSVCVGLLWFGLSTCGYCRIGGAKGNKVHVQYIFYNE